ncbi:unnamed protein product, partial [Musa hybrid cultivar]
VGNTACTPYAASGGSIRVVNGIAQYVRSVRAAELMVDNPGQFVCDSDHLDVGCRNPGLAADEELERRRLYFLLPMDMLFSVLTEEEMAALSCRVSKARISNRIRPVRGDLCLLPAQAKKANEATRCIKRRPRQSS